MKTNATTKSHPVRKLAVLPKLLIFSALAFFISLPVADARPKHRHHGHGHGYHHRHHHHQHPGYRHFVPPHRPVYRGWSRPGFHGAYPPVGYVNYRYINVLPRGYRVVYHHGHPYYYANGAYYWPARYQNRGVYIQVNL